MYVRDLLRGRGGRRQTDKIIPCEFTRYDLIRVMQQLIAHDDNDALATAFPLSLLESYLIFPKSLRMIFFHIN